MRPVAPPTLWMLILCPVAPPTLWKLTLPDGYLEGKFIVAGRGGVGVRWGMWDSIPTALKAFAALPASERKKPTTRRTRYFKQYKPLTSMQQPLSSA